MCFVYALSVAVKSCRTQTNNKSLNHRANDNAAQYDIRMQCTTEFSVIRNSYMRTIHTCTHIHVLLIYRLKKHTHIHTCEKYHKIQASTGRDKRVLKGGCLVYSALYLWSKLIPTPSRSTSWLKQAHRKHSMHSVHLSIRQRHLKMIRIQRHTAGKALAAAAAAARQVGQLYARPTTTYTLLPNRFRQICKNITFSNGVTENSSNDRQTHRQKVKISANFSNRLTKQLSVLRLLT